MQDIEEMKCVFSPRINQILIEREMNKTEMRNTKH